MCLLSQEEYYATHQCFLTNRSLFLLVWNAVDGEAGLLSLRFWLENIEVCNTISPLSRPPTITNNHKCTHSSQQVRARDSPVIVVATHADSLPQANYKTTIASLQTRLRELYSRGPDNFAFPRLCSVMHVVSCKDNRQMDQLRNYIYNTAVQYCPPCKNDIIPSTENGCIMRDKVIKSVKLN